MTQRLVSGGNPGQSPAKRDRRFADLRLADLRSASSWLFLLVLLASSLFLLSCVAPADSSQPDINVLQPALQPSSTPAPIVTAMPTPTPTTPKTPTATATASPAATSTRTATPTATATPSPLPTPDGESRQVRLPILMYHYLSEPPAGADKYRIDLSVSPDRFEEQLAFLREQGYRSVSFYDLLYHLTLGRPLPSGGKPIILSFDDGYLDNYENAFPLLAQYGFTATFFVVTELAERATAGLIAPNGFRYADHYATWPQLREMAAAGMDIECHARVHEDLMANDDDRLIWQVLGCREMIERELGYRPRIIAYPTGAYDQRVIDFFASDHYWAGVTTRQGDLHSSDHLFEIQRLRIRNTTSVAQLAQLLAVDAANHHEQPATGD